MANWQKIESSGHRLEHRITLTRSGYVGFPAAFYEKNQINSFKYTVLYYAPDERAMGIRFTNESEKGALKIHHSAQSKGGSIVARNFFKIIDLDYKSFAGRYEWNIESPEGIGQLYVLKLREKPVVQTVSPPAGQS